MRLGVDILLSTNQYSLTGMASSNDLKLPFGLITTDYELSESIVQLITNSSSEFKIFTPIDYGLNNPNIKAIGFPIRAGLEKKVTQVEINQTRESFGVEREEAMVLVQMGSLAMGIEREIGELLIETRSLIRKAHFIFLCVNNRNAFNAIDQIRQTVHEKIVIHLLSEQNDVQMNLLIESSDLTLGKPGGSTVSEHAAKKKYLVAYKSIVWERPNLQYLKSRGQGHEIHTFRELVEFINSRSQLVEKQIPDVLDWKQNLIEAIEGMVLEEKTLEVRCLPEGSSLGVFSYPPQFRDFAPSAWKGNKNLKEQTGKEPKVKKIVEQSAIF